MGETRNTEFKGIVVERDKLIFLFFMIALTYVLSPLVSWVFFRDSMVSIDSLLYFSVLSIPLLIIIFLAFKLLPRVVFLPAGDYKLSRKRILIVGSLTLMLLLISLQKLYGGLLEYFIATTYIDRTGAEFQSSEGGFLFSISLVFSTSFCSLLTWDLLYHNNRKLVSFLFLAVYSLVFVLMGSRNLLLWSFSPGLLFVIKVFSKRKILFAYAGIVFLSMLFAAYRNAEKGDIMQTILNLELGYFDPIIHEYGTTFRVFQWLIIEEAPVPGASFFSPYSSAVINLLPSIFKPKAFMTFSTALSHYNASNGEGLGNSPIAEYAYAYFFPSIVVQILPIMLVIIAIRYENSRGSTGLKMFALSFLPVLAFNFWRIGFAEIMKFTLTFAVGYSILFPALKKSRYIKAILLELLSLKSLR